MCDTRLNELCRLMIAQDARIRGRSACFENDQEVCTVLPMLYPIDPIDLSMLVAKLKISSADADADVKPMVQVLMPASSTPILIKNNDELLPPIIATLGQPIINPVIIGTPLPVPLMLTTTTTTTTTPAPAIEIDTTTITTTSSTTSTTTSTTPPPATSPTTIQIPIVEMVTTTAPTTITSSTAMPQPNDTLVLDIEEPHLHPNETQENHGNAIPNNNSSSDGAELPLPTGEHQVSQSEQVQLQQTPLVEAGERVVEHVADTVPDTVAKTEYETVVYIPMLLAPPATPPSSKTNLLEEDSQDSQSNSVLPGDLEHAAQDLQIPEEPPEE